RIGTLPPEFIKHMLDHKKPGAARNWLKALRHMLDFAVAEGCRADNPARGIKLAKMKTKHRRPWTQEEIEQYERTHAIGSKARLALALASTPSSEPAMWFAWGGSTSTMAS